MELNNKVAKLEDELKVLKNEVQAVLLDLRENYLTHENPFSYTSSAASPATAQPITINQPAPSAKEPLAADDKKEEDIAPEEDQESEPAAVKEPDNGAEPAEISKLIAEKTAHEEVKRVRRTEIEPVTNFKLRKTADSYNGKTGLATIAGLAQWVAESTKRLGRERVKVILEISEMMGHLTPDIKQVLVKLIDITPDGYLGEVTTRDYLVALIELANLLGKSDKSEVALLSILYQENDHR